MPGGGGVTRDGKSANISAMLQHHARSLIDQLDTTYAADTVTLLTIQRERGWIEGILHFAEKGMLTAAGIEEAKQALTTSREWADTLFGDELVMPTVAVCAD